MNKHIPVLIVLLGFGLVGCVSDGQGGMKFGVLGLQLSHEMPQVWDSVVVERYEDVAYPKAEAINLASGEKFHYGKAPAGVCVADDYARNLCPDREVLRLCNLHFGSACVLSRFGDTVIYNSFEEYKTYTANQARIKKEYEESSKRLQRQQLQRKIVQEQEEKERLIASLAKRCEGYGFTGDNNIAACIQREAQHDKELEMQKWELEKTRIALQQAQSRTYVQQPEEEEIPLLIQVLGNIAIGVSEGYKQAQIINAVKGNQKTVIQKVNCDPKTTYIC